jgi:tetratricopeptide (TPR) repeat protein
MSNDPGFDVQKAHRYFSADCFNKAWALIEKAKRTPEEDEQMIRLNQTSLWHWTQRDDCRNTNMSIGYWQASRIYAILGRPEEAKRYGRLCLEHSRHESPFLLGYAYEALARAEKAGGNISKVQEYFAEALRLADGVLDVEDRKLLLSDLETVRPRGGP